MIVNLYTATGGHAGSVTLPSDCWPDLPEVLVLESSKRVFLLGPNDDEPGSSYVEVSDVRWCGELVAEVVDAG